MANVHKAKQVPEFKKELVKKLGELIKKCSIIGLVNMENLPAAQLQRMKAQLRGKVEMFMAKKRLIRLAIAKAKADKKDIEKLEEHFRGMPALIFTDENPFCRSTGRQNAVANCQSSQSWHPLFGRLSP